MCLEVLREGICETLDGIGPALEAEDYITTICTYVWTLHRLRDKTIHLILSFYKLEAVTGKKMEREQWLSRRIQPGRGD
jgi:hypothetical protein